MYIVLDRYKPIDEDDTPAEDLFPIAAWVVYQAGWEALAVTPHTYILVDTAEKKYIQRATLAELVLDTPPAYRTTRAIARAAAAHKPGTALAVLTAPPTPLYTGKTRAQAPDNIVSELAAHTRPYQECECSPHPPGLGDRIPPELAAAARLLGLDPWTCTAGAPAAKHNNTCYTPPPHNSP